MNIMFRCLTVNVMVTFYDKKKHKKLQYYEIKLLLLLLNLIGVVPKTLHVPFLLHTS